MSTQLDQLEELQTLLHEVNVDWARSAAPLKWSTELDGAQRLKLAADLQAVQARWEDITHKIHLLLHLDDAKDERHPVGSGKN